MATVSPVDVPMTEEAKIVGKWFKWFGVVFESILAYRWWVPDWQELFLYLLLIPVTVGYFLLVKQTAVIKVARTARCVQQRQNCLNISLQAS